MFFKGAQAQVQTVRDTAKSHQIDYITQVYDILNPEGF